MKLHTFLIVIIVLLCGVIGALGWLFFTKIEQHKLSVHDQYIPLPDYLDLEQNEAFSPIGPKIPEGLKTITKTYYPNINPDLPYQNPEESFRSSVYKDVYHYDRNGNLTKRSVYKIDGTLDGGEWIFKYDAKGNRISDGWKPHTVYQYDEKGNRIGWIYYNSDGSLASQATMKYDDKNRLVEEIQCNASGEGRKMYLYSYDLRGQILQQLCYDSSGNLDKRKVYIYDERGNNVEWVVWNERSGRADDRAVYHYDDQGNLIEEIHYFSGGYFRDRTTYRYDDRGNIIEKRKFASKEADGSYFMTTYQYNEQGQLIEQSFYPVWIDRESKKEHKSGGGRYVFEYEFEH
jgi:hypothetical protein